METGHALSRVTFLPLHRVDMESMAERQYQPVHPTVKKFFKRLLTRTPSQPSPATLRNTPPPTGKMVWRISDSAPLGEWVDPTQLAAPQRSAPNSAPTDWTTSSMDLLSGMEVHEHTMKQTPASPKAPKKQP